MDFIQIIYEFTNPIQDFIPALSRKDFVGLTYIYNPSQNVNINEFILKNATTNIHISDNKEILEKPHQIKKVTDRIGQ